MKAMKCIRRYVIMLAVLVCAVTAWLAGGGMVVAAGEYPEIIPENLTCYYGYEYLGTLENGETLQKFYKYLEELAWGFYCSDEETIEEQVSEDYVRYIAVQADMTEVFSTEELEVILNNAVIVDECFSNDNPIYYYMRTTGTSFNIPYDKSNVLKMYASVYTEETEDGVYVEDFADVENRKYYRSLIETKLHEYYDLTKDMKSDYEKERAIYEKVMSEVIYAPVYEKHRLSCHSIIGVFTETVTVCDGYAQAFQIACNYCGIDCIWVEGYAGEAHAWNAVKLDNEWYSVDATWDDLTPIDDNDSYYGWGFYNADKNCMELHLNMPYSIFAESHTPATADSEYGNKTQLVWPEFSDDDSYWGIYILNEKADAKMEGHISYEQMLAGCNYIEEQLELGKTRIDLYAWDSYFDDITEEGDISTLIRKTVNNFVSTLGDTYELSYKWNLQTEAVILTDTNNLMKATILVSQKVEPEKGVKYYKYNIDGSGKGIRLEEYPLEGDRVYIPDIVDGEEVHAIYLSSEGRQIIIPNGVTIVHYLGAENATQIIISDTVRDIYGIGEGEKLSAIYMPASVKYIFGVSVNKVFGYAGTKAEEYATDNGLTFYDVTGKELVDTIEISNFVLPEAGENIADVLASNSIESDKFNVTDIKFDSDDVVARGFEEYTVEIHISAKDNYVITPNTLIDLNGEMAWVECVDLNTAVIKYTYALNIKVDESNFPDEVFREYIRTNVDTEGGMADGCLTMAEVEAVTSIYVSDMGITDLKGIELFPDLLVLYCNNNKELLELDLSSNTELYELNCSNTGITSLDISMLSKLYKIDCSDTNIESIDMTMNGNESLYYVLCSGVNVENLNISNCTYLQQVECSFGEVGCCYDFSNFIGFDVEAIGEVTGGVYADGKITGFAKEADSITFYYNGTTQFTMTGTFTGEHNYVDNVCSGCGLPLLKFSSRSLSLSSDMSIKYKVNQSLFEDGYYTNPYVVFEFNGKEITVTDYTIEDDKYVFRFDNIAPKQLNDSIYTTLYAEHDGEQYSSITLEYSCATYCYEWLNETTDTAFRTLLVDILNYGADAQIYFGYNTTSLANAALTDEQKSWATTDEEVSELENVLDAKYETVENPEATWEAVGLRLEEAVNIRLKVAVDSLDGIEVRVRRESGGEWSIPSSAFEVTTGGYYVIVEGLKASQMGEEIYAKVYKNGVAVSNTLRYSIESYAYDTINDVESSDNLKNLLNTMMKYCKAAYKYVNR